MTSRLLLGSEFFALFVFAPGEIKYITVIFSINVKKKNSLVLLVLKSKYILSMPQKSHTVCIKKLPETLSYIIDRDANANV